MADLLSKEAYRELAGQLEFRTQAFINGQFRTAKSGRTFTTTNPATGDVLAEIAACDAQDVDEAVAAAKTAFEDARWQGLSPAARKSILLRFAQLLEDNAHELAVLDRELESRLTAWFDVGFLELQRLTWSSPASFLAMTPSTSVRVISFSAWRAAAISLATVSALML